LDEPEHEEEMLSHDPAKEGIRLGEDWCSNAMATELAGGQALLEETADLIGSIKMTLWVVRIFG
jgi:hypothetical protein